MAVWFAWFQQCLIITAGLRGNFEYEHPCLPITTLPWNQEHTPSSQRRRTDDNLSNIFSSKLSETFRLTVHLVAVVGYSPPPTMSHAQPIDAENQAPINGSALYRYLTLLAISCLKRILDLALARSCRSGWHRSGTILGALSARTTLIYSTSSLHHPKWTALPNASK
jgi:hypothetical protein